MTIKREDDPLGWAKEVLDYVAAQKIRWGRMWSVETDRLYRADDMAEAAGIVMQELKGKSEITQEAHTKLARQLTASKAREGKQKKQIEKLKEQVGDLNILLLQEKAKVKVDKK